MKTKKQFSDNVEYYYIDEEIKSFLSSQNVLEDIYNEMKQAEGAAVVCPFVIPKSEKEFNFELMLIVKHEKATEEGQWELFDVDNFVLKKTNLRELFQYIELTTKTDIKNLLHTIQQELKRYREHYKLNGKTFLEIDQDKKIVAFGCVEE